MRARRDGLLAHPAPVRRGTAPAPARGGDREPGLTLASTRTRATDASMARTWLPLLAAAIGIAVAAPVAGSVPETISVQHIHADEAAAAREFSMRESPAPRTWISAWSRSSRCWRACPCSSPRARVRTSRWSPIRAACNTTTWTCVPTSRPRRRRISSASSATWDPCAAAARARRSTAWRGHGPLNGAFVNVTLFKQAHVELPPAGRRVGRLGRRPRARWRRPRAPRCRWRWTARRTASRPRRLALSYGAKLVDDQGHFVVDAGARGRRGEVRRGAATARCPWTCGAGGTATWTASPTS